MGFPVESVGAAVTGCALATPHAYLVPVRKMSADYYTVLYTSLGPVIRYNHSVLCFVLQYVHVVRLCNVSIPCLV